VNPSQWLSLRDCSRSLIAATTSRGRLERFFAKNFRPKHLEGVNEYGRDLGSTVAEGKERIAKVVTLPSGYRMIWAGEFEELEAGTEATHPGAAPPGPRGNFLLSATLRASASSSKMRPSSLTVSFSSLAMRSSTVLFSGEIGIGTVCNSLPAVFQSESHAGAFIRSRVAKGTTLNADEAGSWDNGLAHFPCLARIYAREAVEIGTAPLRRFVSPATSL
jgi:hypothetical protein